MLQRNTQPNSHLYRFSCTTESGVTDKEEAPNDFIHQNEFFIVDDICMVVIVTIIVTRVTRVSCKNKLYEAIMSSICMNNRCKNAAGVGDVVFLFYLPSFMLS